MNSDRLYQIALTLVPHIGPVHARLLLEKFGDASSIFHTKQSTLRKIEGLGNIRARAITHFHDFDTAEKELAFIDRFNIHCLSINEPSFPKRLLNCYDAPSLLFAKGNCDLNRSKIVAIVGTRHNTEYGTQLTERLVAELRALDVLVISGLAHGIDGIAHRASLKNNMPTVGVLAHGLDQLYPARHRSLAREMVLQGGALLTEFISGSKPDRHNFPSRNRIVAGISDAIIVVETKIHGGSMITAELGNSYNRDVFAFPGRVGDTRSEGCHHLIRANKANLISSAADLVDIMNWSDHYPRPIVSQRQLFPKLSDTEQDIVSLFKATDTLPIDDINLRSGLSNSATAAALLNLELQQVVVSLPGKIYRLA